MSFANAIANLGPITGPLPVTATAMSIPIVAACTSTVLQLRVRQRRRMMEERMAGSLVTALRNGALDFNLAPPGSRCSIFWSDPDEMDESELQLMPSRYQLLGYPKLLPAGQTKDLVPTRILRVHQLGAASSSPSRPTENLLLGVPKDLLKPDMIADKAGDARIPNALTKPMALRRDLRSDCRELKNARPAQAKFRAGATMAGLKVAAALSLAGLRRPLATLAIRTQTGPTGLGTASPRSESTDRSAPPLTLPATGSRLIARGLTAIGTWPEKVGRQPLKSDRRREVLGLSGPAISIPSQPAPAVSQLARLGPSPTRNAAQECTRRAAMEQVCCPAPALVFPSRGPDVVAKGLHAETSAGVLSPAPVRGSVQPQVEPFLFHAPALQHCSNSLRTLARDLPVQAFVPPAAEIATPAEAEPRVEPFLFTPPSLKPRSRMRSGNEIFDKVRFISTPVKRESDVCIAQNCEVAPQRRPLRFLTGLFQRLQGAQ